MSNSLRFVLVCGFVLAGLGASGCHAPSNPASVLTVDLKLSAHRLALTDTLSYTITLRNKTPWFVTVPFPNAEQAALRLYDQNGDVVVDYPLIRRPVISKLELGPFGARNYTDSLPPMRVRIVDTLKPGIYRVRAYPADYETPYTEDVVELTE
jgi:hypothetical protein